MTNATKIITGCVFNGIWLLSEQLLRTFRPRRVVLFSSSFFPTRHLTGLYGLLCMDMLHACIFVCCYRSVFVSTQINTNGPNNIHTYMILFYCIPIPIPMPMPNYQDCGNRTGTDLSLESQSDHPLSYSEWRCRIAYGPSSRTQYCGPNPARTLRDDCARNGRLTDCG